MKQTYRIGITTLLLSTLMACGRKESPKTTATIPVAVTIATPSSFTGNSISASGQIEASQTAAISTRIMGRINSITVKIGDKVSKGQVLATISDEDIKAKRAQADAMIAEAEAHYAAAQKDYNRFTNLYKQESATAKELEMVTLQYNAAKSRVEAARQMKNEVNAMLGYSTLRAPFDGVVTQRSAEPGNIANPGMPILMIENSGEKQITATVAETDISRLKENQSATILIKSTGKTFEGRVSQITPSSQFSGAQYIIKITIPPYIQKELVAGMYANVTIPTAVTPANTVANIVLVPLSSIVYKDELTGIFTPGSNNSALLRWVRLGKTYGDKAEILSGLAMDEPFIVSAASRLVNGTPIQTR